MKKVTAVLISLVLIVLSGCSFYVSDVNKLMSPPSPTGSRKQVQELIYGEAGEDIRYSYPKSGSYRSAIIESEDITGDGRNDVIGFFESPDDSGGITMIIISDTSGEWQTLNKFESSYSHVDRVNFGDVDGDGINEVIIGWGSPVSQSANICIYDYYSGAFEAIDLNVSYTEMAVGDMIKDEPGDELIVTSLSRMEQNEDESATEIPAVAALYKVKDAKYSEYSKINTDNSIVRYASASVGVIDQGTNAFVIDGVRADNTVQTEIIYWDSGSNTLTLYPEADNTSTVNVTSRDAAANIYARDINKDGLTEIPTVSFFPGAGDVISQNDCRISWNRFDVANREYLFMMDTVVNSEYGYYIQIPDEWRGTWQRDIKVDVSENTLTVYKWNKRKSEREMLLLKIYVYNENEWENEKKDEYIQLEKQNGYVYAARLPQVRDEMIPTESQIRDYFNLMS